MNPTEKIKIPQSAIDEMKRDGISKPFGNFKDQFRNTDRGSILTGCPKLIQGGDGVATGPSEMRLNLNNGKYVNVPMKAKQPVEAVLVKAQNVHDYFMAHWQEHGWNDLTKFSCAKPPFKDIVISYDHSFRREMFERPSILRHVCVKISVLTAEELKPYKVIRGAVTENGMEIKQFQPEEGEVLLQTILDDTQPDAVLGLTITADGTTLPGHMFVLLDEQGQILSWRNTAYIFIRTPEERQAITDSLEGQILTYQDFEKAHQRHTAIAVATLQFMNCKNVEVMTHVPTRQQRRAAERDQTQVPVTYKTIVIHPIGKRKVYLTKNQHDIQHGVSLHIVRGHFKNYNQGRGLGRSHRHGIWWWSPQVRGSEERGRVVKDYEMAKDL